jgi:hypothetical protein
MLTYLFKNEASTSGSPFNDLDGSSHGVDGGFGGPVAEYQSSQE